MRRRPWFLVRHVCLELRRLMPAGWPCQVGAGLLGLFASTFFLSFAHFFTGIIIIFFPYWWLSYNKLFYLSSSSAKKTHASKIGSRVAPCRDHEPCLTTVECPDFGHHPCEMPEFLSPLLFLFLQFIYFSAALKHCSNT